MTDRACSDIFHEQDGTHPMHRDTSIGRQKSTGHGQEENGDDKKDRVLERLFSLHATNATKTDIEAQRTRDKFNFSTGVNQGAKILIDEMKQLIERDGYAECFDDVSGERLEES